MKTFIIAEAGVNHNGDADRALAMVETAAECGADAIKFQTFKADNLVIQGAAKADYQLRETGGGDQYSMLKSLEMSEELHLRLMKRCRELDLEFMSTPFDAEAAVFLQDLGMRHLKIPSGEITNLPFLRFLSGLNMRMILSTGMADLDEVKTAVGVIVEERERLNFPALEPRDLVILHCTSNYPADVKDVNLRAMNTIANATGQPIGYSDHTLGLAVSTAAVAMGAVVIEKHFTLDRSLPGPDHNASLTPPELAALVEQIRSVELALGIADKKPTDSELAVRKVARRSVATAKNLEAGATLVLEDLAVLRPGDGIPPGEIGNLVGRKILRHLVAGTTLHWSDID